MDQEKIRANVDWPRPSNISQLRGFLGLVKNYAALALSNFLRIDEFVWDFATETTFLQLKQTLTTTLVL